jgi:hypothetical protein
MKIRTNYQRQILDSEYPLSGSAVAEGVNFKTSQTLLIGAPKHRQFMLRQIVLLSTAIAALSNGATVVAQERNVNAKTAATLSTTLTGANNDIVLTAKTKGVAGNAITLALVDPSGNDQALAVEVTGTDIVVSLATSGAGAITTTATQLLAALAANEDAGALVTGALKGADTGAAAVTALAETALSGGLDYVLVQEVVASTNLVDSDAVGKSQILTLATGVAPIQPGNEIALVITAGTATTDEKTVVVEGLVL